MNCRKKWSAELRQSKWPGSLPSSGLMSDGKKQRRERGLGTQAEATEGRQSRQSWGNQERLGNSQDSEQRLRGEVRARLAPWRQRCDRRSHIQSHRHSSFSALGNVSFSSQQTRAEGLRNCGSETQIHLSTQRSPKAHNIHRNSKAWQAI